MSQFNPNVKSLKDCLETIAKLQESLGIDPKKILTSHDAAAQVAATRLSCTTVPAGFEKWMLPFNTKGPATFYLSFGAPNTEVPKHSHDEGAGIRIIMSGSIIYEGQELTAGDWMYLPAGSEYSFRVGRMGVGQFYCYECCCGGIAMEGKD